MAEAPRTWTALPDADAVEKIVLATAFAFFAQRMLQGYLATRSPIDLLYLVNEACLLIFVLARRRTDAISRRTGDWLLGFAGTLLPLLLVPATGPALLPAGWLSALMLTGFAIQFSAKLTLRRSFGVVAANRGVKASGPYRAVRHPMYAGYMLTQASLFLAGPNPTNALVLGLAWSLQIARILAEERVLAEDETYRALMARTRYRLVPGLF
jgi:protein-S-isoprenylcysteine O-methyltransferase Ste14